MSDKFISQTQLKEVALKRRREARARRLKETLAGAARAMAPIDDETVNSGGEVGGTVAHAVDALDNTLVVVNDDGVGGGVGRVHNQGQKTNLFLKLSNAFFKFFGSVRHRMGSNHRVKLRSTDSMKGCGQTDGGNS